MSIGIGGACRKITENEVAVQYEYYSYDLNEERFVNPEKIADGTIIIWRAGLVEPEIHSKKRSMPGGRKKLIEKRVAVEVDLDERLASGYVEIKNCSHAWRFNAEGIDVIALHICRSLFEEYQIGGALLDMCGCDM